MIFRQILALGVVGGISAAMFALFYRRYDLATTITNASPMITLAIVITALIFVLSIGLATPIEPTEIGLIFTGLLMLWGTVLVAFGGFCHFYDPGYGPAIHKTPPQPFLARKIGILYMSLGIQCLVVGFAKTPAFALLVQLVLVGWGLAILYLFRSFYNYHDDQQIDPKKSPPPQTEDDSIETAETNAKNMSDREASLRTPDFYFSVTIPILLLTLYIFGDNE